MGTGGGGAGFTTRGVAVNQGSPDRVCGVTAVDDTAPLDLSECPTRLRSARVRGGRWLGVSCAHVRWSVGAAP